jgi:hypothetical protein
MPRDPEKAKERKRRYLNRVKAAKYGADSIGVDMRGRHGNHAKGMGHARYNGGIYRTAEGYTALAVPEGHHLRQANGYAYEHQLVAEAMLGRRLIPGEVVHHRNGNRSDNRPENLEITTRSDHARHHASHPDARDEKGRFIAGLARSPAAITA